MKESRIEYLKTYNELHKEEIKLKRDKYYQDNKEEINRKKKIYHTNNNDKMIKYRQSIKDDTKEYMIEYRKNNKDKIKEQVDKYKIENIDKIKNYKTEYNKNNRNNYNEYIKNRLKTDSLFKLGFNIRSLVRTSFKRKGLKKNSKTIKILGCTIPEFKNHIENLFEPWMNWDNYGLYNGTLNYGWDIDHIIGLKQGTTEDEIIKLNHHTNLRPLCSYYNRNIKR